MDHKRIKRLLDLKRRVEMVKKGELVEARRDLDLAEGALQLAAQEQAARLRDLQGDNTLAIGELQDRARFATLAGVAVGKARETVARHDQIVEQREQVRIAATREVRTFELISERKQDERRLEEKRREQTATDEAANAKRSRP